MQMWEFFDFVEIWTPAWGHPKRFYPVGSTFIATGSETHGVHFFVTKACHHGHFYWIPVHLFIVFGIIDSHTKYSLINGIFEPTGAYLLIFVERGGLFYRFAGDCILSKSASESSLGGAKYK